MRIRALESREDFEGCLRLSEEVYRGDAGWVAPDAAHHIEQLLGESAFSAGCRLRTLAAEEDGRMTASVTALVDPAFNAHWGRRAGHLFFFECLPGRDDAARALLGEACGWLRGEGSEFARLGFLYGWQIGLTIDGYGESPTFLHDYNRPYYHSFIKDAGFCTEKGLVEYRVRFDEELAAAYRGHVERAEVGGVRLRSWDFARLEEETRLFRDLYNETFAAHWGAPQFTYDQLVGLTAGMRDVLSPEWLYFAESGGETAGVVYSLPDMNRVSRDHGVLMCIGVKERYRGRGVNLALASASYLGMMASGCTGASYTIVLDDNWASRRTAEKLGCRVARSYNVYRRDLKADR